MKRILMMTVCTLLSVIAVGQQGEQDLSRERVMEQISGLKATKDEDSLAQKLEQLHQRATEEDLQVLYTFYSYLKKTRKADEVKELALQKYPKSELAYMRMLEVANAEKDLDKKEKLYKKIVTNFRGKEPSSLAAALATEYAVKGDHKHMLEFFQKANKAATPQLYMNLLQTLARSNPTAAEPLLEQQVDSLKVVITPSMTADLTLLERSNSPLSIYYNLSAAYINSLLANKKKEEAQTLATQLNMETGGRHPGISSAYFFSLVSNGRYEKAFPLIAMAFSSGNATPEIRSAAKEVYIAVKGDYRFEEFISKLENDRMAVVLTNVAKKAIEKPSADFILKDVDGKTISLSELKGKVVVLDFWATWCVPCKASFPLMQKAVNMYKDNPQVKFLFIHTWEQEETAAEDAKKYILDNNYTFQVLMDLEDAGTGKNKVVDSFSIQGLPTKAIIGPNGNIYFQVSGFNNAGSEASQLEELAGMIEYARAKG